MGHSAGVALLILGLVLGPAYYVYGRFFSGSVAATHALTPQQPGGSFAPLALDLKPDMGKVGLVLRFQVTHGPVLTTTQMPRNAYRAVLKTAGRTIFDKSFSLASTSVEAVALLNFSEALPVFQPDAAAVYQLEVSPAGEAGMNLIGADVEVRQGVVEPDLALVGLGVGLLAAGAAALLF